jgi:hypothetical protein
MLKTTVAAGHAVILILDVGFTLEIKLGNPD